MAAKKKKRPLCFLDIWKTENRTRCKSLLLIFKSGHLTLWPSEHEALTRQSGHFSCSMGAQQLCSLQHCLPMQSSCSSSFRQPRRKRNISPSLQRKKKKALLHAGQVTCLSLSHSLRPGDSDIVIDPNWDKCPHQWMDGCCRNFTRNRVERYYSSDMTINNCSEPKSLCDKDKRAGQTVDSEILTEKSVHGRWISDTQ